MLKHRFEPTKPLRVVLYLRMSSDKQNPRSPQQQEETIRATIKRLGLPWVIVRVYIDEAISGRYTRKRPQFQQMLADIRTGKISVDAILVDTFERFGRAEELAALRQELQNDHGVLVLTADSQFADPTSVSGKALTAFESMRATEDNRIKAHNVLRGKRDALKQKHWPGGPPPFGYRLESVLVDHNGRQEVDHCILVPDPKTAWIIQKIFEMAYDKGLGCTRIAKALNADPSIPSEFKPFLDQTVNAWLGNAIYVGDMLWEKNSTGVVDDQRVIQPNRDDEILRVPGFCEPLISREIWDAVQENRRARSERIREARAAQKDHPDKEIAALTPGLALKYLLSGLVTCGHCNRAMVASSSPIYHNKAGESRRYVSYVCPGYTSGICSNHMRVPEEWLRGVVVDLIRRRLLPG